MTVPYPSGIAPGDRLIFAIDRMVEHALERRLWSIKLSKGEQTPTLKEIEFQGIPIEIDRPLGFVQEGKAPDGSAWKRRYLYDYGFIPKTDGGDAMDTDVFIGPNAEAATSWWAVQLKNDGAFDEFKVFLGFSTFALAKACYNLHIPARFCAGFFAVPVSAIKSILGLRPVPVIQGLVKRMRNRTTKTEAGSFDQISSAVAAALRDAYPPTDGDSCSPSSAWVTELYDDAVIFTNDGQLFKDGYTFANGKATLAGSPVAVMRAYVPVGQAAPAAGDATAAGAAGDVTMNAKNQALKAASAGGAGDIVSLASERLAAVAGELGKGDGKITPDQADEISAVTALLEIAVERYGGPGAETEDEQEGDADGGDGTAATDGAAGDLQMALDDAEKNGGTVAMTPEQVVAYAAQKFAKIRAEKDATVRATKTARVESMLLNALAVAKSVDGETIPVVIVPEDAAAAKTEPTPTPNVSQPTTPDSGGAQFAAAAGGTPAAEKMVAAAKSLAALRAKLPGGGGVAAVAKSDGAAATAPTGEVFTEDYVATLPDSAFLFVDPTAKTDPQTGRTEKAGRHFPVYDVSGQVSGAMVEIALKSLPTWGSTIAIREDLTKRAQSLAAFSVGLAKSRSEAGVRGETHEWPEDLNNPGARGVATKGAQTFGFDDIAGKLAARPAE